MCMGGVCSYDVGILGSQRLWILPELVLEKVVSCQTRVSGTELGPSARQYALLSTTESFLQS